MGLSQFGKYGDAALRLSRAAAGAYGAQAFILEGDHTVDKKGVALAFAQAMLCREEPGEGCGLCPTCRKIADGNYEDLYLIEPDEKRSGTSSVKDAQVEELQAQLKAKPAAGERNFAIVSGADTMTMRAQTRFLKTLEEPSGNSVIVLLSENAEQLLPTIRSRCVTIRLTDMEALAGGQGGRRKKEDGMTVFAGEILDMVLAHAFFFDIKKKIDKKLKSRQDTYAFLDGMEKVLEQAMRAGGALPAASAAQGAGFVEQARRLVQQNAVPRYVVMGLILQLEELL